MNTTTNRSVTVIPLGEEEAVCFIRRYHYSKIMPRLNKLYLGFFQEDMLCGVAALGWGTQPLGTLHKLFPRHQLVTADYLEIGKLCLAPQMNQDRCTGSQVLSAMVKWLKQNTQCLFLYTLADGIMGKCGFVYQASNFRYLGEFSTKVYRNEQTGEKIHPRSAKALLQENAALRGREKMCWLDADYCATHHIQMIDGKMFRYIMPLNSRAERILAEYPEYAGLSYPKEKDLHFRMRVAAKQYVEIAQPSFNMDVCEMNAQKFVVPEAEQAAALAAGGGAQPIVIVQQAEDTPA